MQRNLLTLSVLAALATVAPMAHAVDLTQQSSNFTVENLAGAVVINFTNATFSGFQFSQLTGLTTGNLTSVSVNATLNASANYTYADDLTIYVDALPLSSGGLLQVGGFNSLSASERHFWANGGSSLPGTTVIDTVFLTTPISFTGGASDPAIFLGNGYGDLDASGTWTGSVTLNFAAAAVPEPGTWALGLAGAAGLMAWSARRRRSLRAA